MRVRFGTLLLAACSGCTTLPLAGAGWVDAAPGKAGAMTASAHGGVVVMAPGGYSAAGEVHVDPRVSATDSLPVDASLSRSFDGYDVVRGLSRIGWRHRARPKKGPDTFYGVGAGPNWVRWGDKGAAENDIRPGDGLGVGGDFEIGIGLRSHLLGLSYTLRPGVLWNQRAYTSLWVPSEAQGALFVADDIAITLGLGFGVAFVFPDSRTGLGLTLGDSTSMGLAARGSATLGLAYSPAHPDRQSGD